MTQDRLVIPASWAKGGYLTRGATVIMLLTLLAGLGALVSCAAQPSSRTSDVPMVYRPYPPNPNWPPPGPVSDPSASAPHPPAPVPEPPAIRHPEPAPGTLTYLDFKNGFRDLTFGEPPAKDMHLVEDAGELKFYRRMADNLTIGGAQVHQINYGFYKNQLESVLITTKGITNSVAILDVLRQAYGKGSRPNQFMDRYMWEGTRVFVWYDRKPISHDAEVLFQSKPLHREHQAEEKEKARKGVSGL